MKKNIFNLIVFTPNTHNLCSQEILNIFTDQNLSYVSEYISYTIFAPESIYFAEKPDLGLKHRGLNRAFMGGHKTNRKLGRKLYENT